MKQILQSLKNGQIEVATVPNPCVGPGELLIRSRRSLISAGTERMLVEFGKANLIDKARQQPHKVRQVIDKVRTDGILPTLESVRNKLDQPIALGYCNIGEVIGVGDGVSGYAPGDRVVSNGHHAEIVCVPTNLCARVPSRVSDDTAAFTVISAIALQGLRLVQPTLGESIAVLGLGLIGLITVQLLRANGCRVLAVDLDPERLKLARQFGATVVDLGQGQNPVLAASEFSDGKGVDGVLISASTKSSEPVHQAASMCRQRGRIVLVGVTGLELSRADFYEKELTFQVSCSYGPGRYDSSYEEKGNDYPLGFVRWTEQRNFQAVLEMMQAGKLVTDAMITHRFPLVEAEAAYELIAGTESSLGILLEYPVDNQNHEDEIETGAIELPKSLSSTTGAVSPASPTVGFIGSGNYATAVLIPAFKATNSQLNVIASKHGVSSLHAAKKFGVARVVSGAESVIADPGINCIAIATRHNSHANLVRQALLAGKHVFVEKPLAISIAELDEIQQALESQDLSSAIKAEQAVENPLLMIGFNRRFAPHVKKIKSLLQAQTAPKVFVMTVNAGAIPPDHWTQDPAVGGSRIVGEACHFIDLLRFLADQSITTHSASFLKSTTHDSATIQLGFADGSMGTIHYLANGDKSFAKERLEIFVSGRILQLDNFRKLSGFGWPNFRKMNLVRQDKGQRACVSAFVEAIRNGLDAPIPVDQIFEVSRISIELSQ